MRSTKRRHYPCQVSNFLSALIQIGAGKHDVVELCHIYSTAMSPWRCIARQIRLFFQGFLYRHLAV
jgi:hypothetical protein